MPNNDARLKVGIVGMGIRGMMFAATVEQNDRAKLAAVAETSPAVLEEAKNRFGVAGAGGYSHAFTGGQMIDGRILGSPSLMLHSFIDDVRNER